MNVLQRLFAGELAGSLEQTKIERDWYRMRCENAEIEITELKAQAKAEREVHALAVRHLISQVLKLAGAKTLPNPEKDEENRKSVDLFDMTEEQQLLLRQRAEDACSQKIFDRPVTTEDIDAEYEAMMQAPHYYLAD